MPKFADVRKVGFDTETTGVNVRTARIVTAALVIRGGNRPDTNFTYLINPGVPIPREASEIHGITDDMVKADGISPRVALEDIAQKLTGAVRSGMPIVAFNLSFDWSLLHYELQRYGLPTISERVGRDVTNLVDPFVIDKAVDKYRRGKRKLQPTCELYGIDEITNWHDANADALGAVLVAEKLFEKFPYLNNMGPARLFSSQKRWKREQAESLQGYFRNPTKCGPDKFNPLAVVNGEWPLQTKSED